MKRKTIYLLLITAMALTAGGFSTAVYAQQDDNSMEEDLLSEIDEVNDLEKILEEYGSITINYHYTYEDLENTIYYSDDNYVEFNNAGYILVDDKEQIYGRDSEDENDYFKMACFSEEDYETFQEESEQIQWYTGSMRNDNAQIKEEDNTLIITIPQEISEEDKENLAESFDVNIDDIQDVEYRLEADPETKVIHRIVYSLNCGSTGIMIADTQAEYGTDIPELSQEMTDFLNETDVRKITLVIDPGTEDETTFEDTIRKGCSYRIIANEYDLYSDKDCTIAFEGSNDLTKDSTIYLKAKDLSGSRTSMNAAENTEEQENAGQIDAESFGILSDGNEASLYTLENVNGMSISVSDYGAALVDVVVPDKNNQPVDVVLGYDNASQYEKGNMSIGAIVGRVANRIGGASFDLDGKTYTLTANEGENTLHGGCDFYVHRLWQMTGSDENSITFRLESTDGDQGFPGNLTLDVTYTLTDENEVRIEYSAKSDKDTLLAPTNHSYFNLNGEGSGDVLSQLVTINADYYTELDSEQIPTGEFIDVTGTDFDFREQREIGACRDGNYDHNYAINGEGFREAATMYAPETGITMTVSTDFPGLQFYTAGSLNDTGKNGALYGAYDAACFETQFFPDAIHHDNFTQPILKAGETFTAVSVYAFSW